MALREALFPTLVAAAAGAGIAQFNYVPLVQGAVLFGGATFLAETGLPLIASSPLTAPVFRIVPPNLAGPLAAGAIAAGGGILAGNRGYAVSRMGPVMNGVYGAVTNYGSEVIADSIGM